jgi:hypothetical protein
MVLYITATIIAVNMMNVHSKQGARMYFAGTAILAGLLMATVWFWLGSGNWSAWLGGISEDAMKYIGVWLVSADGPLLLSLIVWFASYSFFSFIGYFLGQTLYDARH